MFGFLSADGNVDLHLISAVARTLEYAPAAEKHPFWVFEWDQLAGGQLLQCSAVLFLAGLLCSAGGIGGGGIYVTVLMVAGGLSPRNAVPLSKAVVFFGALASLVLNLRRSLVSPQQAQPQKVIDYSICRLVVPAALIGTLMGVVLNRNAGDSVILFLLITILLGMSGMATWTTWTQYKEEVCGISGIGCGRMDEEEKPSTEITPASISGGPGRGRGVGIRGYGAALDGGGSTGGAQGLLPEVEDPLQSRPSGVQASSCSSGASSLFVPRKDDTPLSLAMLFVVVTSGAVRYHVGACIWELNQDVPTTAGGKHEACAHPIPALFFGDRLENWLRSPWVASLTMLFTLLLPVVVCLSLMAYYGRMCIAEHGWRPTEVLKYQAMAVITGCLAGLIGIGGGLVFSPFFLFMGVEPMVAVATSSTCVIFTSSSTTLQYLLTDRIIMSLTLVYGIVNVLASYGGTSFVHFLQDRFGARRSYISSIVAAGVLLSAALSIYKLVTTWEHHSGTQALLLEVDY